MIDLKPNDHARLRRAFRFLDDQAPLGPDLPELVAVTITAGAKPRRFNPALIVVGTVLATLLLFVPIVFLVTGEDSTPPGNTPVGSDPTAGSSESPPVLASGDNWTVSIWEDGPEICHSSDIDRPYQDVSSTSGQGCQTPSSFSIPNVLNVDVTTGYDDKTETLMYEGILGLVTAEADRLVVTFESGDIIELQPGETTRHGYRGFGVTDLDAPRLGEPTTIEVFKGETSLGVYSHQEGKPIS